MDTEQLNLLIPEDLPVQHELDQASKEQISLSLNLILRSLESDFAEQAIAQVDRALNILGTADISPCDSHPKGAKKHQEAQDYDNYFNVVHVKSNRPEISLVRSILVAYQRFILLGNSSDLLDAKNIKIQQQGFTTYVQLLSRVFDLSLN